MGTKKIITRRDGLCVRAAKSAGREESKQCAIFICVLVLTVSHQLWPAFISSEIDVLLKSRSDHSWIIFVFLFRSFPPLLSPFYSHNRKASVYEQLIERKIIKLVGFMPGRKGQRNSITNNNILPFTRGGIYPCGEFQFYLFSFFRRPQTNQAEYNIT